MKNKLPLIVGVLILASGIGIFLLSSGRKNTPSAPQPQNTSETQTQTSTQQKSLKDLLSLTKPQECTFSDSSQNRGKVSVSGNKMRGDFTSEIDGKEMQSHIIVDSQTSYLWVDGQNTGYKMSFEKLSQDESTNQSDQIDVNKPADYNCKDWNVNPAVFNIPTDITFTDLGKLTPPAEKSKNTNGSGNTQNTNSQCAACDTLSGDAKTQCKQALNCN